jgi:DNA/RNA-binding domain of Phe-tRNA-synthetase-like protein
MWFVMEALETMPTEALHDAGNLLIEGLRKLIPGCEVSAHVVCAVDRS